MQAATEISNKIGYPDFLGTRKCNPNWPEVWTLLPGQITQERTDHCYKNVTDEVASNVVVRHWREVVRQSNSKSTLSRVTEAWTFAYILHFLSWLTDHLHSDCCPESVDELVFPEVPSVQGQELGD